MAQTTLDKTSFNVSNKGFTLRNLQYEVQLLRSFVIGMIGEDKEGRYNPKFAKELLKAAKEKPTHLFRGAKPFLEKLRQT